jgi:hypothetical protein
MLALINKGERADSRRSSAMSCTNYKGLGRLPRHGESENCSAEETTQTMSKLGKKLIGSAKEARSIARGEAKAATYRIHPPGDIDVQSIRMEK